MMSNDYYYGTTVTSVKGHYHYQLMYCFFS